MGFIEKSLANSRKNIIIFYYADQHINIKAKLNKRRWIMWFAHVK